MKGEIERFEGTAGFERYLSFLQESHRHYEVSIIHVLRKNFYSLLSMVRLDFLLHLFELHPFESIWYRASKYFWTERLRRVFTFASMYMGMSPFDAPGTYSLLQYTELAEGIWYPIGGFHKVRMTLEHKGNAYADFTRLSRASLTLVSVWESSTCSTAPSATSRYLKMESAQRALFSKTRAKHH